MRLGSYPPFFRLFALIAAMVAVVLAAKMAVNALGLDIIALGRLHTAFTTGVLFTLAILFSGTLADFKEAERLPGEMSAALRSLYNEVELAAGDRKTVAATQVHVAELLGVIQGNFQQQRWRLREIISAADKIGADIAALSAAGTAPGIVTKLRTELGNVERCANRVESIMETTFVPMAYLIAQIGVIGLLLNLLFVEMDPVLEGLPVLGGLSFLLISLLMLIRDMDNPFAGYVNVDLSLLQKLERYFQERGGAA